MRILLLIITATTISIASAQISLEEYRSCVLDSSTEVANATVEIEKAGSTIKRERTNFLPSISADGEFSKTFRRDEDNKLWGFSINPQISQTIYDGGAIRAAWKQAHSSYESTKYLAEDIKLAMCFEADFAYWQVSATQLYWEATNKYIEIIKSLYNVVKQRYSEGYVAKSDLLQVEARLSDAEFSLIATRQNYEQAVHLFNNLRGEHEPTAVVLSQSIIDSIAMPQRILFAEIIIRRPDVSAAEWALKSAEYGVNITRAAYNPTINAGIGGSWQTFSPNPSGKTYCDAAVMVGVSVPIFHWGERRHAVAEAKADERIAFNLWEQVRDDIEQEEADGWSALQSSYAQMQSSLRNLEIAGENLDIATYSYNEGQATVLDVLQAQISWIQIYTNAITARFNYAVAVSAYMRLTAED